MKRLKQQGKLGEDGKVLNSQSEESEEDDENDEEKEDKNNDRYLDNSFDNG